MSAQTIQSLTEGRVKDIRTIMIALTGGPAMDLNHPKGAAGLRVSAKGLYPRAEKRAGFWFHASRFHA